MDGTPFVTQRMVCKSPPSSEYRLRRFFVYYDHVLGKDPYIHTFSPLSFRPVPWCRMKECRIALSSTS